MLVKPWWIWKCSSSWEHAQALRVIIGTNWDSSQFPRQCYDLFKQWIHSLLLGSSPVTRIIPSICILFPACTAIVPFYHGSLPFPVISKFIHYVVFNKVIHIIQVRVCHSTGLYQTIVGELPQVGILNFNVLWIKSNSFCHLRGYFYESPSLRCLVVVSWQLNSSLRWQPFTTLLSVELLST